MASGAWNIGFAICGLWVLKVHGTVLQMRLGVPRNVQAFVTDDADTDLEASRISCHLFVYILTFG